MQSILFAVMVAAVTLAGAGIGMALRRRLPRGHLDSETREFVKAGVAFLSTLTGIVLGLIVASAKGSFDQRSEEVQAMAAKIVLLNTQLRRLGDAGDPLRDQLAQHLASRVDAVWGKRGEPLVASTAALERLQASMQAVPTTNNVQRTAVAHAARLMDELSQIRSVAQVQAGSPVLIPLLMLILCWLTMISAGLNLFAHPNGTVIVTNALWAVAAASAVFLILEMERGFGGVIQVSDAPMREAIAEMRH